jgi:hypothetical protein
MLMTALGSNPIHCLNCNLEVEPASIPLPEEMIEDVAHWQSIAGAFEVLELDSGPCEEMAKGELVDLASPVNEEGLTLRVNLDKVRRCFYVHFQGMSVDGAFAVPDVCPRCGNKPVEYTGSIPQTDLRQGQFGVDQSLAVCAVTRVEPHSTLLIKSALPASQPPNTRPSTPAASRSRSGRAWAYRLSVIVAWAWP